MSKITDRKFTEEEERRGRTVPVFTSIPELEKIMNETNKYPNADTSPERLAEITTEFETIYPNKRDPYLLMIVAIRDLLAMLQERAEHVAIIELDLQKAATELHDQRWRRFTEKPETFPIQVMFENLDPIHLYSEQAVPKGVLEKSWWRPIPPLPKE